MLASHHRRAADPGLGIHWTRRLSCDCFGLATGAQHQIKVVTVFSSLLYKNTVFCWSQSDSLLAMNPLRACALFLLCVSHLVFGQQPENQVRVQLLSPVEAVVPGSTVWFGLALTICPWLEHLLV